jgi:hypothetical protein
VHDDPARVRAYSRLVLYDNAALVSETLCKLSRWLHEVGTGRDLKLTRRIYVLASLAEAEGSGMIFDVVAALPGRRPADTDHGDFMQRRRGRFDPNTLAMANVMPAAWDRRVYLQPEQYRSTLLLANTRVLPAVHWTRYPCRRRASSVKEPPTPGQCAELIAASLTDLRRLPPQPIRSKTGGSAPFTAPSA